MNTLVQQESTIIGSEQDITQLQEKTSARILILSDSHGDFEIVTDIILKFGKEVDALIYTGDGFCDLVSYFEKSITDEKMHKALPPVIIPVRGNGDASVYTLNLKTENNDEGFRQFSLLPKITCNIAGRGVFVSHGDHYRVDMGIDTILAAAHAIDADMIFFGHTHRTHWEEEGGTLILNPGSCSKSRSNLPPSFAIVSFPGKQDRFKIEYYGIENALFKNHKFSSLNVHMN